MTRLSLCLLLLATLAGCIEQPGHLEVKEDMTRAVTCWQSDSGMACLPNWMLKKPEPERCMTHDLKSKACRKLFRENASTERQLSPHETQDNGPTPALANGRWIDERYEL